MDEVDFETLAKELMASRLKDEPEAPPPELGAQTARRMILAALPRGGERRDARGAVATVCRGVMSGALLLGQELPPIAVALLSESASIANEASLDPTETMTWAMEGLAPVCRLAGAAVESAAQDLIEAKFMGAGEAFAAACRAGGT